MGRTDICPRSPLARRSALCGKPQSSNRPPPDDRPLDLAKLLLAEAVLFQVEEDPILLPEALPEYFYMGSHAGLIRHMETEDFFLRGRLDLFPAIAQRCTHHILRSPSSP